MAKRYRRGIYYWDYNFCLEGIKNNRLTSGRTSKMKARADMYSMLNVVYDDFEERGINRRLARKVNFKRRKVDTRRSVINGK